jgi:hypothetical protein
MKKLILFVLNKAYFVFSKQVQISKFVARKNGHKHWIPLKAIERPKVSISRR